MKLWTTKTRRREHRTSNLQRPNAGLNRSKRSKQRVLSLFPPLSPVQLRLTSGGHVMGARRNTLNAGEQVKMRISFANDFDEHALAPLSIELAVKNLLPWSEVQFPF